MKQFIWALTFVGVGCIAWTGSAQTRKPTPAVEPVADITVIGCVEPTDPMSSAGKTADSKYMLTNVKPSSGSGTAGTAGTTSTTSSTAGTTGTTGSSSSNIASTYQLDAPDTTIAPEVGHEVEIIAVAPAPDTSGKTPKLKVQRIKFLAAACPAK
jgi:hypothetical protein